MSERIANSLYSGKSYSLVPHEIANGYPRRVRGKELKAIRLANLRKLRETRTLEEIAQLSGTNATYLSQIANEVVQKRGKQPRALSDNYAAKIEAGLGLEPGWMDHPHDAPEDDAIDGEVIVPRLAAPVPPAPECHPILIWESPDDLPEGRYVLIPRRRVALSAGNGHLIFEEEEAPPLAFTTDWARAVGLKAASAVVVYAKGDSMEPRIREGDILLVDLARREISDGKIYALRYNHELRVKRLFRRYDGALIVRSDNVAAYPDEIVPAGDQNGHVEVIGRVIWRGGDL